MIVYTYLTNQTPVRMATTYKVGAYLNMYYANEKDRIIGFWITDIAEFFLYYSF